MVNAAIYTRISKDSAGKGLGVDRQVALCRKLADSKGWTVVGNYQDNDISAFSGRTRPAYQEMLSAIRDGRVEAVVVVDQDRLTRSLGELADFIDLAREHRTLLVTASGDLDLTTADGELRASILGSVARHESNRKSERLRRMKDQAAAKGHYSGGPRPFGFQPARDKDGSPTLHVVPEEAAIIRAAAEAHLSGVGLRAICIDWNARGITTPTGATWKAGTLRNLLTNPGLAALRQHRGEIAGEAIWPAILDRATFERLRAKMGNPRQPRGGRPPTHLLSGLLTCHKCGSKMYFNFKQNPSGTLSGRYGCPPKPQGCAGTAMSAEEAERIISEAVLAALDSPAMAAVLNTPTDTTAEVVAEISTLEVRLEQLSTDYYVDAKISEREYQAARQGLHDRLTGLQSQIQPPGPLAGGRTISELWETADVPTRRAVLSELVESIVVGPGVRGRRTVDPDRLTITWKV